MMRVWAAPRGGTSSAASGPGSLGSCLRSNFKAGSIVETARNYSCLLLLGYTLAPMQPLRSSCGRTALATYM